MQKSFYALIILSIITLSCNSAKQTKNKTIEPDLTSWYTKDFTLDGIPGISLDKAYSEKLIPKTNKSIIVAVIDTQIDATHEALQGKLWVNQKEIPNNGIDDDNNGYVDDINGWNFTAKPNGKSIMWSNYEYIRLIRKWQPYFAAKDTIKLSEDDAYDFKEYKRALAYRDYYQDYYENWRKSLLFSIDVYPASRDSLKKFFPKEDYTMKDLDSLYKIHKINDKTYWERKDDNDRDLGALIDYMRVNIETTQRTLEQITNQKTELDSILQKNLNTEYNERNFLKDRPDKLEKGYGNNKVSEKENQHKHSTEVSGIIAAKRNNKHGTRGFSDNIKIMPLAIAVSGDTHDKDIALAIYYAVDNGAKVINMSFGKEFSLQQEWVTKAIQYAEQKNVLLVHVAGNKSRNVDTHTYYPCDYNPKERKEISSNLITVGATTHKADSTFVSAFSSYGKKSIDLFAPGSKIYTTFPDNKYNYDSGTSLAAPMVSATAALIWLSYPKLTVQQLKQIILDSGTTYNFEVLLPGGEGKKVPFKELSKTGKVLNVYNALKMAAQVRQ
jgi:subtilisin family serine protease